MSAPNTEKRDLEELQAILANPDARKEVLEELLGKINRDYNDVLPPKAEALKAEAEEAKVAPTANSKLDTAMKYTGYAVCGSAVAGGVIYGGFRLVGALFGENAEDVDDTIDTVASFFK